MNVQEAMAARHSVRQYKNQALTAEAIAALRRPLPPCGEKMKPATRKAACTSNW